MLKNIFTCLLLLFTLGFASCGKENNDSSNNDCGENLAIKDFAILERVADTALPTNAALTSGSVLFKASDKYETVSWEVGSDPTTFTQKEFSLIFSELGIINITLVGSIKGQYQCDGRQRDTITKQLEIRKARQSFLPGKYKGIRLSNPTDTFTVEIKQSNDPSWTNELFIYNFPKGCTVWYPPYPKDTGYLISAGARNFRILNDLPAIEQCLYEVYATGSLKQNDSLEIDFRFRTSSSSSQMSNDKFLGKKL